MAVTVTVTVPVPVLVTVARALEQLTRVLGIEKSAQSKTKSCNFGSWASKMERSEDVCSAFSNVSTQDSGDDNKHDSKTTISRHDECRTK